MSRVSQRQAAPASMDLTATGLHRRALPSMLSSAPHSEVFLVRCLHGTLCGRTAVEAAPTRLTTARVS